MVVVCVYSDFISKISFILDVERKSLGNCLMYQISVQVVEFCNVVNKQSVGKLFHFISYLMYTFYYEYSSAVPLPDQIPCCCSISCFSYYFFGQLTICMTDILQNVEPICKPR